MLEKKIWIPILIVLLAVVGCGLFYGRPVAEQEPTEVYTPVEVEREVSTPKPPPPGEIAESGHWHGNVRHSEPHEAHAPAPPSQIEVSTGEAPIETAEEPPAVETPIETEIDFVNPTSTSSNPLFAEGVPKHLQCPQEWVGVHVDVLFDESDEPLDPILETILEEVAEKWNPNRPLPEVWDLGVERNKQIKDEKENVTVDMLVQLMLDVPEWFLLFEADRPRAFFMLQVALGERDPDWNVAVLHDGQIFRMKANYRYEVSFTELVDVETGREAVKSYDLGPPNPFMPVDGHRIITLDKMSDREVAELSGWNYNINPYTTGAYKLGENLRKE